MDNKATSNPEFYKAQYGSCSPLRPIYKWRRRKNRIFTKAFKGKNITVWKQALRTARSYTGRLYPTFVIVEMVVHHKAERRQPTDYKCRASSAKVVAIYDMTTGKRYQRCHAHYDRKFVYRVGQTVRPVKPFNPANEVCRSGIHFFLTRAEAEGYVL